MLLYSMLESAAGISIPRVDEGRGVECCIDTPVGRHHGRSYQDHIVRLPVRLGGMGLRDMKDICSEAYIRGVEQALPHFIGAEGVCQQLYPVLGEMRDSGSRWSSMFLSGCRTGFEFKKAWDLMREEANQFAQYLERELEGPLQVEAEGAGNGRVDGNTRRLLTTWLEDTRAAVLRKGLESYPDQSARPVWVHPNLDKDGYSPYQVQKGFLTMSFVKQWPDTCAYLPLAVSQELEPILVNMAWLWTALRTT